MKLIEALKRLKMNRKKVTDLAALIKGNIEHMDGEKTKYSNPKLHVESWVQSIKDISLENEKLLARIQKTNLETPVSITLPDGKIVTKSISEWICRRREGIDFEELSYRSMRYTLKDKAESNPVTGELMVNKVVHNFEASVKDQRLMHLSEEPLIIDSALEIVNATTDLMEI